MEHDECDVDACEVGDHREHAVPERERVPRVKPSVPELVRDRDGRRHVPLRQLAGAREMEEDVTGAENVRGPPEDRPEGDRGHAHGREGDSPLSRGHRHVRAGGGERGGEDREAAERNRQRERPVDREGDR